MKLLCTSFICFYLCFPNQGLSQNAEQLRAINSAIWEKFTKAFETKDIELFSSLHAEDLIRISGDGKTIRGKTAYIRGYESRWHNKGLDQTIAFRFLERICNREHASERGIYKLTHNPNTDNEVSYYGKFHVILKQVNKQWKILVDYDSSEHHTIGDPAFNAATALNAVEPFERR
ncbi:YybH family protein [Aestuariivivens sediminis]|uniref:YybH family protein n=1 Tax=Aestuariivivens sediminis TaxID=2913557 RepID=UPI001F562832|nr:nuclear transport factor 2 family protein [Aestuariivivens sediminis]